MKVAVLAAPMAVSLFSPLAHAYRPFDQTDADVVEYQGVEVEIGPALQRSREELILAAPALVLNYGIRPRFELVVEGKNERLLRSPSEHRWQPQDVAVSLKALARRGSLQGDTGLSVALEPSFLLPGRGQTGVGTQIGVILSVLGSAGALHLNIVPGLSRVQEVAGTLGLIAEGPWDWRIRPVGEWSAYGEVESGWAASMLYGFIVRAGEGLSFDGAFRTERAPGRTTLELRAGLTWLLGS